MRTTVYTQNKIKSFEGLRLYSYKCPSGVWTCGYGHTKGVLPTTRFSQATADRKFLEDLGEVEVYLNDFEKLVGGLTSGQYDALASFIFNLGTNNFHGSTLRRMIVTNKASPKIGDEIRKWRFSKNRVLPGLVKRRDFEAKRYYET